MNAVRGATAARTQLTVAGSPFLQSGRRYASNEYAKMKVKKNNWIEVGLLLVTVHPYVRAACRLFFTEACCLLLSLGGRGRVRLFC